MIRDFITSAIFTLAAVLATTLVVAAQRPTVADLDALRTELRPLLDAIRQVESNNNDDATGDDGNAIGAYQIWRSYWQDATDWCTTLEGDYESVRVRVYAERIVVAYWHRYARQAIRDGDYETLARIHNGGPRGAKKQATVGYWKRVEEALRAD